MNYNLDLNDRPFQAIKNGKKKIETRTLVPHNMTPYSEMKKGDTLTFSNETTKEVMVVDILRVTNYKDIPTLLAKEGQENVMSYDASYEEAVVSWDTLRGYTEGIKKYGIWAIEVKPVD